MLSINLFLERRVFGWRGLIQRGANDGDSFAALFDCGCVSDGVDSVGQAGNYHKTSLD
jgi:hypothetical protein